MTDDWWFHTPDRRETAMHTHAHTHKGSELSRKHIHVHGTLDLHFFLMGIATAAWGLHQGDWCLHLTKEKKRAYLRRVWITSVAEQQQQHTHTHTHTHTQRSSMRSPVHDTLDLRDFSFSVIKSTERRQEGMGKIISDSLIGKEKSVINLFSLATD